MCLTAAMDEVREGELTRPDGRIVAWTEFGDPIGVPMLRIPGTPGSRWSLSPKRSLWLERNLWAIGTERPGFGRSTPLPGRGFAEHADDLVATLDHLGIDRTHVIGGSGAAPHILALCERHPDRVTAASISAGIAPLIEEDLDHMLPQNVDVFRLAADGDRAAVEGVLTSLREFLLGDPDAAVSQLWASAPEDDREILADPNVLETIMRGSDEALARGVAGWVDESMAFVGAWDDINPEAIGTDITWYHSAGDRNCPITAVRRLVSRIPSARLIEWPETVGHLYPIREESTILDELLAR